MLTGGAPAPNVGGAQRPNKPSKWDPEPPAHKWDNRRRQLGQPGQPPSILLRTPRTQ